MAAAGLGDGPGRLDDGGEGLGVAEVVEGELAATQRELAKSAGTAQSRRPTRVEVVPAPPTPLESIAAWLDRFTAPAATAGIVLLFLAVTFGGLGFAALAILAQLPS